MRTPHEISTNLSDALSRLTVRHNVLATADLMSQAAQESVAELRRIASAIEVAAIDLASIQRGDRAALEG